MSRPEKQVPTSLDEALAELKRDPAKAVHARVEGMDVELRVVPPSPPAGVGLGDWMAAAGPWQGVSEAEILELLREARRADPAALKLIRSAGLKLIHPRGHSSASPSPWPFGL